MEPFTILQIRNVSGVLKDVPIALGTTQVHVFGASQATLNTIEKLAIRLISYASDNALSITLLIIPEMNVVNAIRGALNALRTGWLHALTKKKLTARDSVLIVFL